MVSLLPADLAGPAPAAAADRPSDVIILAPGLPVRLQPRMLRADGRTFASVIEDVADGLVYVVAPMAQLRVVTFPLGTAVRVSLRRDAEFYAFDTVVMEQVFHPQTLLGLALPPLVDRSDQRGFYRLDLTLPADRAAVVQSDGAHTAPLRATLVNVSGGGVELVTPEPVRAGQLIALHFTLAAHPYSTLVQAVRVEEPPRGRFNYRAHCQFLNLDRKTREAIIRFVFREQLVRLRRGQRAEGR